MSFQFWQNEEMTESVAEITPIRFNQNSEYQDLVFYFGSPDSSLILQTKENAGVDFVTLSLVSRLPEWRNGFYHQQGAFVLADNHIYQSLNTGESGNTRPDFPHQRNARVSDNTLIWRCIGKAHGVDTVKMALSYETLEYAGGGADLALGSAVRGGSAVAVHIRLLSQVDDVYELPTLAQIGIVLNECQAVSAD